MLTALLQRMDEVEPQWRAAQGRARMEPGKQYRQALRAMIVTPTVLKDEPREIGRDTPEWRVLQLLQGSAWAPLADIAYAAECSREEAGAALRALHRFGFSVEIRERDVYEYRLTQPVRVESLADRWVVEATPCGIMLRVPKSF